MPWKPEDLAGQQFGKLTVVRLAPKKGARRGARWHCNCECGGTHEIAAVSLKAGVGTHCGCSDGNIRHGGYKTKLYKRWSAMRRRCQHPNSDQYKNYGARGITVCDEWQRFEPFRDWATANGYRDDLEIDRIDNNAGYSPDNCRFVDRITNANNLRTNRRFNYEGSERTIAEISRMSGMRYGTLRARLIDDLMPVSEALTLPIDRFATRKLRHGF